MRIAAVLLAAGQGKRFGGEKLMADVGGQPMAALAMDALLAAPVDCRIAVVSDERVAALARAKGIDTAINNSPELGLSRSIAVGIDRVQVYDAVLFLVADQPLLTAESLARLIDGFREQGGGIACLRDETHIGNPAVFSREFFPQLSALTGDRGAKGILRAHHDRLLIVDCLRPYELEDADDPAALAQILALRYESD
ncbi:MAG: nucleotidyltransferase family protein [Clostridia bacterium]|nr:nucleotidyltransferase family protein [Clostridia bacterium]